MKLSGRHYAIILFGLITAVAHLLAAFDKQLFQEGPDPIFILNGLGYLGLLAAYFLPIPIFQERHELVRKAFIVYAIITIIAWLVIWVGFSVIRDGIPFWSRDSLYGVPAKISEVILIWLLSQDKATSRVTA
jgi:hypothetical protein